MCAAHSLRASVCSANNIGQLVFYIYFAANHLLNFNGSIFFFYKNAFDEVGNDNCKLIAKIVVKIVAY